MGETNQDQAKRAIGLAKALLEAVGKIPVMNKDKDKLAIAPQAVLSNYNRILAEAKRILPDASKELLPPNLATRVSSPGDDASTNSYLMISAYLGQLIVLLGEHEPPFYGAA